MHTSEDFKEANDARLDELETRGNADPLRTGKLARIDRGLEVQVLETVLSLFFAPQHKRDVIRKKFFF